MNAEFDVLIVGAGPAGSTLAARLARPGLRIGLIDARRFPRAKPCGEFLSPQCLPILDEIGAGDGVRHQAHPVDGMRLHGYGRRALGRFRDVGSSKLPCGGFAIRREVFDHDLLRHALDGPGVRLLDAHLCTGLVRSPGGAVAGVHVRTPSGGRARLTARWVVGADGVRSVVARGLGVHRPTRWLDKFALATHYAGVAPLPTAEVHLFPGGYFAATTVGGGLFGLNLVVDRARLRDGPGPARAGRPAAVGSPAGGPGRWDAFLLEHLSATPELAERLVGAERVTPVRGIGPLAGSTTRQVVDGCVLVGDACGYVDPVTGEGIFFALRGAQMLAPPLAAALATDRGSAGALADYRRARRAEFAPRFWSARLLQRALRLPRVAGAVLQLLEARRGLADLLVSVTGDYVRGRELCRPRVWWRALRAGSAP